MVQVFGERMKSDLFPLKTAHSNDDDLDEYTKTLNDLGKVNLGKKIKRDKNFFFQRSKMFMLNTMVKIVMRNFNSSMLK